MQLLLTPSSVRHEQRGAAMAHRNVLKAVDSVLDLPQRATTADASVHGAPVQGIVSASSGGDAQLVRRTSFFAKVSNLFAHCAGHAPRLRGTPGDLRPHALQAVLLRVGAGVRSVLQLCPAPPSSRTAPSNRACSNCAPIVLDSAATAHIATCGLLLG